MDIELKRLSIEDGVDIYNLLQEIPKDENGFINSANGFSFDEYKEWLVKCDNWANEIGLEDGRVPQIIYWLFVDKRPVGMGKLRTRLTEKLKISGGHCGYGIAPSQRGKGYGTLLLKMIAKEAVALGLDKILLTINIENKSSIKIAINSGGIIEKTEDSRHYIWIGGRL
ncbi:MAG: GNAT family N-acetyltransferase [Defluviitaleaceae bacterium]|nr:GNAT family N-acetyltransferase [Defluviitaleaceae bacterium]